MRTRKRDFEDGGDAVELLRTQHREMEALLAALAKAGAPSVKASVVAELGDLFAIHFALEERVLYPGVREADPGRDANVAILAVEDHMSLKRLVAELLETDAEDRAFDALVATLRSEVREHIVAEEKRVLPAVRRRLSPVRLRRLAYEMRVLEFELRIASNPRLIILADTDLRAPLTT
jgi:hemerythrin-like domain-containing protein